MGKKTFRICAAILAVAIGILMYLNFWMPEPMPEGRWIQMANKNITWAGAGYNGIYGRKMGGEND